jgi:Tol biopolymer transport system component
MNRILVIWLSKTGGCVLLLFLLPLVTQCSPHPDPPAPSQKGQKWGVAREHDNVTLLSAIGGTSESPVWSPDGTQIAFQHSQERPNPAYGGPYTWDVYVMNSDGTGEHRLTNTDRCYHPSWSPDGRRLVCSCEFGGELDLYIVDVTTKMRTRLTDYSGNEMEPSWSADGAHIVFSSNMDAETQSSFSIYTVGSDGTNLKRVTEGTEDREPVWSPDSKMIAFSSTKHVASVAEPRFVEQLCLVGVATECMSLLII